MGRIILSKSQMKIKNNQFTLELGMKLTQIFENTYYYDDGFYFKLDKIRNKISFPPIKVKSNNNLKENEYRFLLNRSVIFTKYLQKKDEIYDSLINDIIEIMETNNENILKWKGNLENIESWINDICLFIISKQDVSVGIKYIAGVSKAPILLSRQYKCKNI